MARKNIGFKQAPKIKYLKDDFKSLDTAEITTIRSPLYEPSQFYPYNPDRLYQKKGNYDIYDEMRRDDQIKSILSIKKSMVLSSGWDIAIDDEIPVHTEIRDSILKYLNNDIEIGFEQSLREMLSNLDYGISITEPVWKIDDNKIKLKYLKTRPPHSFRIFTDDIGNIEKLEQDTQLGIITIDPSKVIIFPFQMEFGNWYGRSDLDSAYRAWWSKDIIIKFWNIFLEKWGSPTAIGRYDSGTANQDEKEALDKALKRIQTSTSIRIPKEVEIELLETARSGSAGYESAIDKYNMMMARSMGVPDLLGIGGAETNAGAYALGQKHFELFYMIIEDIRESLTRTINRKIIHPLIKFNWMLGDIPIPKFTFNPINIDARIEMLKTWIELVKGTGYQPTDEEINWARRTLNAPEGDVDFKRDTMQSSPVSNQIPDEGAKPINKQKDIDKDKQIQEKQMARGLPRPPMIAERRVNFEKVVNNIEKLEDKHIQILGGAIATIRESLINAVEKGRFIENKRLDKIDNLKLKGTNNLKMSIKSMLRDFHDQGLSDAKDLFTTRKLINIDLEAIIDEILNKQPVFISQKINDDILAQAKIALKNTVIQGLSLNEAISQLKDIFAEYDPSFNGRRLEIIVRTNSLKAYNQTKQAYFKPFEKSGDIVAYQYSAIIDTRTSNFCATHDGKIYRSDNPYLADIEPPNHFQCRSTLIPITNIEFNEGAILGATRDENNQFFQDGKFKESGTFGDDFKREPGGFFKEIPKKVGK
jgi:SPP1 gp7 family putative phage head morphogenesis protein